MGQRSKRQTRCERCRMHVDLCICADIPSLHLETRVILVMHRRERHKTTSTGLLALAALPHSELRLHGYDTSRVDLSDTDVPSRRVLLLFPDERAEVLNPELVERDPRPVTLVVPDGSWRQAAKMARRLNGLDHAERVRLPAGPTTRYLLRTERRADGLATFEAIARALGLLESPSVQLRLESLFERMVERTLMTRGR